MTRTPSFILAAAAAGLAAQSMPAAAQPRPELQSARQAGIIGERYDGYLGYAATPPEAVRRQVGAINIRRRALYVDVATRRRVAPQSVAIAAGCELLTRVAVGEAYMLADGQWRRRQPGEKVPLPDYCG